MSSALGISSVTAVLESLLWGVYNGSDWASSGLGAVAVTAVAPDLAQNNPGSGSDSALQVNLFLHQVTFNAAWRNMDLPSLAADGQTKLKNAPLALDLHYLLTVYASEDCQAEALLGYAVQFLFENPILARGQIRSALASLGNLENPSNPFSPPATNPLFNLVSLAGLADQIEMIKIMPVAMGREEMAWVWTALKADYRLTFPFQVSVVLIQPQIPAVSPLPVLKRRVRAQPNLDSPYGTLLQISPPSSQPAAMLGNSVTVEGANLSGVKSVTLSNARLGVSLVIQNAVSNVGDLSFQFALTPPEATAANLPAGVYLVSAQIGTGGVSTNSLPLAIAPQIQSWSSTSIPSGANVVVPVTCAPNLFVGQQASLLIGEQEGLLAAHISAATNALNFTFANLQPTSVAVPVRLRVDGVDSSIIDMTKKPPIFAGPSTRVTL